MTDRSGESIVAAVRSVRRFTEDVAKLLDTARESLQSAGWISRTTQAISVSTSLNLPHKWIPQEACWFVVNERFPNHLLVVAVVFDSIEGSSSFTMPVVMSGCMRFDKPVPGNWPLPFAWSRLCERPEVLPNGTFCEVPGEDLGKTAGIEKAEIAVQPLTSLTNAELLERLVLQPLLSKVEG